MEGIWHDGRLDCVAGNGVMSELGVGDEVFREDDADRLVKTQAQTDGEKRDANGNVEDVKRKQRSAEDLKAVEAMPVVILRNFGTRGGGEQREVLVNVLSQWAASVAENQVRLQRFS